MSKTGQCDNEGSNTVAQKKGCDAYTLYVTYTEDGPMHDAVCIDAEHDEFEVDFDDGCASIHTAKFKYLMLRPEQLRRLANLIEKAEKNFQVWSDSRMRQEFDATGEGGKLQDFLQKYKEVLNLRSKA